MIMFMLFQALFYVFVLSLTAAIFTVVLVDNGHKIFDYIFDFFKKRKYKKREKQALKNKKIEMFLTDLNKIDGVELEKEILNDVVLEFEYQYEIESVEKEWLQKINSKIRELKKLTNDYNKMKETEQRLIEKELAEAIREVREKIEEKRINLNNKNANRIKEAYGRKIKEIKEKN